jgi:ABC-type transport system involved in multi-copper enzyme maturation permease subunit
MTALPVTRNSLAELRSRRLVLTVAGLSFAFVALFAAGFASLHSRAEVADADGSLALGASTLITVLGLYAVHFVTAFLAMFIAVGAVSGPLSSGTLHAVLARPISRGSWLLQRWLALAVLVVAYPTLMTGALLLTARVVAGYQPLSPVRAALLLALEGMVLVSLALWASSRWSTVTSGVVVFSLFGLSWLAGIIEFVGQLLDNATMRTIGIAVSLVIPTDALWRGASFYLQSPGFLAMASTAGPAGAIPFAGNAPPAVPMLVWSAVYAVILVTAAGRHFSGRDL